MSIKPKPLTAANAELFQAWADKLSALIESGQGQRIARMIADMVEGDPEFAAAIEKLTAGSNEALAVLESWAKSKPMIAARLHKAMSHIPMTVSALRLALECISETADNVDALDLDAITYEEARDYCAIILDMTA